MFRRGKDLEKVVREYFVESCRFLDEKGSTTPFILSTRRILALNLIFIQEMHRRISCSAMSTTQTSISFPIRKKCNFYGRKDDVVKEDFTNATARYTSSKYTPTVKKIVTLTSSESESESDIENSNTEEQKRIIDDRRTSSADSTPRSRRRKCSSELDGKKYYFIFYLNFTFYKLTRTVKLSCN